MNFLAPDTVIRTISSNDAMWKGRQDEAAYLHAGWTAARAVACGLSLADVQPARILDFGCGHGRVLRWLRALYPQSEICAMDRVKDAIEFCAKTFDARPQLSNDGFAALAFDGQFDLIWLGSVYTHLNLASWDALTRRLLDLLPRGKCLAFSYAGPYVARLFEDGERNPFAEVGHDAGPAMLADYAATGFGYAPHAAANRDWGRSIISHARLFAFLNDHRLKVHLMGERLYDNRQDIVVVSKQ